MILSGANRRNRTLVSDCLAHDAFPYPSEGRSFKGTIKLFCSCQNLFVTTLFRVILSIIKKKYF